MSVWFLLAVVTAVTCQQGRICSSVDIRNKPEKLEALRGCRVVEGFVRIVLMERGNETDFDLHSLPELREITEYLLIYRVVGLRRVGQILPNLTVIRGERLFQDYALVVYEMMNLQELGLSKLAEISRGAVRIEKNPSLCYVETLRWDQIAPWDTLKNHLYQNKDPLSCPGCDASCPHGLCWSRNECQVREVENATSKCHPLCLGDCMGPGPKGCYACRKYLTNDNECVANCPPNTYQYLGRSCITESDCLAIRQFTEPLNGFGSPEKIGKFFVFNGTCSDMCPDGLEIDPIHHSCVPCRGKCSKHCYGGIIETIEAAQRLRGCTHIEGSIEISIRTGQPAIVAQELEDNLGDILEITGLLKIVRSSLINLHFLKSLTTIHGDVRGEHAFSDSYAMIVSENQNLQELWDWSKKANFKILKNRLFFHYNPKLCFNHILKLIDMVHQENVTDLEVSKESNGDKFPCDAIEVKIPVTYKSFNRIQIHIPFVKLDSKYSFLRYVVYYVKDPGKNISKFDDLDQCSDYGWMSIDLSLDMYDQHFVNNGVLVDIDNLEPDTQYSYYVTAYTIDRIVITSDIQTDNTLPTKPADLTFVKAISNSSSEIIVSWKPPKNINGKIEEYIVAWTLLEREDSLVELRDYCKYPMTSSQDYENSLPEWSKPNKNDSSCCVKNDIDLSNSGFKKFCLNLYQKDSHQDFAEMKATQTCESFFNNYVYFSSSRQHYEYLNDFDLMVNNETKEKGEAQTNETKITNNPNTANKNNNHKSRRLPPNSLNYTITNARHFQDYVVTVKVCREKHPMETDSSEDNRCSRTSTVIARTQKDRTADNISNTIDHEVYNRTLYVSWVGPSDPNGFVVAFEIEYKQKDVLNPKPIVYCVPYSEYKRTKGSYSISDLFPGTYEFRIRAISLAGQGPYTNSILFIVSKPFKFSDHLLLLITLLTFMVIVLILGSVSVKHLKTQKLNINDILIASVNPQYTTHTFDEWELDAENVILGDELGSGTFGKVYEGTLRPDNILCAVKVVTENLLLYERNVFLSESSIMKSVSGAYHIVRLLGVVSKSKPPLVVMELMNLGDLRSFLISSRDNNPPGDCAKLRIAAQIADGMCFMEAKKFVHRDLAARNCLVKSLPNGDIVVKVGDFGMTRDIYETDYYRKGDKGLLPIRWMAPESLKDGLFTSQSDVWSFGVVLWETVTLGEQPYQGWSNEEVLREVMGDRLRLQVPSHSPKPLKTLMTACWSSKPTHRVNFMQMVGSLEYYIDESFKEVSYYHSEEAANARKKFPDYVEMSSSVEDPLLADDSYCPMNGGVGYLLSRPSSHAFISDLNDVIELSEEEDI